MPIQINRAPGWRDGYDLWWYVAQGRDYYVAKWTVPSEGGPAHIEWVKTEENQEMKATLTLSGMDVRDLKEALDREGPTTNDSVTHLRDTIQVRDRLLTLVEGAMNARNS